MAIKRYTATKDNTITNAFKSNLSTRGTGSNMGASDTIEVFSIYGQTLTSSTKTSELARSMIQFDIPSITADRTAGTIPVSGSVDFYLRLYNAEHPLSVPKNYDMFVSAIATSWDEGYGLDMEEYKDLTSDRIGSNWRNARTASAGIVEWTIPGCDFFEEPGASFTASFANGIENIEINISPLVEQWLDSDGNTLGSKDNYGVCVRLAPEYEAYFSNSSGETDGDILHNPDGSTRSYYTKRFFGRGTEFFFKRPTIEARWNSSIKDDRLTSYFSSSLVTGEQNENTIYLYNFVRGELQNIPAIEPSDEIWVSLFSGSLYNTAPTGSKLELLDGDLKVIGGYVSKGIYSASFVLTGSTSDLSTVFDVWHDSTNEYYTGSITMRDHSSQGHNKNPEFASSVTNLKHTYTPDETARFRVFARDKNWNPTIYTKATTEATTNVIEDACYKIIRIKDNINVIDYGTGSLKQTLLSYDKEGNYFDLDMSLLDPGYKYGIKLVYSYAGNYHEQRETFTFRVE